MKKTIQKVLNELKADKPDLSYIRGLLEGLVDDEEKPLVFQTRDEEVVAMIKNGFSGVVHAIDPELPPPPNMKNIILPTNE